MITVTCNICKALGKTTSLASAVIARNEKEGLQLVAVEMAKHLEAIHPNALQELMKTSMQTNALLCMIMFESENEQYLEERENVRTDVATAIMLGAPEEEEEEEEEEEDLFNEEDNDDGDEENESETK